MAAFCSDNGMSDWNQAVQDMPQQVHQILAQSWVKQNTP
jgi:hypothetical protein